MSDYGTFNLRSVHAVLGDKGQPFLGLRSIERFGEMYSLDLDPDYQRGHVWTTAQQERFIGHVLEGGWVQPCIVNTGPHGEWLYRDGGKAEMMDGKQRYTSALMFNRGEIAGQLYDGRRVLIGDLDKTSNAMLRMTVGLVFKIVELSRVDALRWYLRLNRGGTVHTDDEMDRVRKLLDDEERKAV